MNRLTPYSILIAAVCLVSINEARSADLSVTPIGVQVVQEGFDKDQYDFDPFNGASGTVIQLLVSCPSKSIVSLDARGSEVSKLTDENGTDLLQPAPGAQDAKQGFNTQPGIDHFPKISKDAHQTVVKINGKRSPAKNTSKILLTGHLLLQVADGVRRVEVKNQKLEAGDLGIDGLQISIGPVGKAKTWDGKDRLSVKFNLVGPAADDLKEIVFNDTSGQPIDAKRASWMTMGNRKQIEYHLPLDVQQATIVLHLWQGLENITLPLDLSISLGL